MLKLTCIHSILVCSIFPTSNISHKYMFLRGSQSIPIDFFWLLYLDTQGALEALFEKAEPIKGSEFQTPVKAANSGNGTANAGTGEKTPPNAPKTTPTKQEPTAPVLPQKAATSAASTAPMGKAAATTPAAKVAAAPPVPKEQVYVPLNKRTSWRGSVSNIKSAKMFRITNYLKQ